MYILALAAPVAYLESPKPKFPVGASIQHYTADEISNLFDMSSVLGMS